MKQSPNFSIFDTWTEGDVHETLHLKAAFSFYAQILFKFIQIFLL